MPRLMLPWQICRSSSCHRLFPSPLLPVNTSSSFSTTCTKFLDLVLRLISLGVGSSECQVLIKCVLRSLNGTTGNNDAFEDRVEHGLDIHQALKLLLW